MLVQFITDDKLSYYGFSAKFHHTLVNTICQNWLNITSGFITSKDYLTIKCSWVITAPMGSTISIQFHVFKVK